MMTRRQFGLAAASALAVAPRTAAAQMRKTSARIAVIYKEGQPTAVMWRRFADLVSQRTKGVVELQVFPGGQLGGEREVAEGMRLGSIQGADSTLAALSAWVPEGQIFDLPFIFRDLAHVEAVMNGPIGEKYKQLYRAQDFTLLSYITYGARDIMGRVPIAAPADVRGKTMRVLQSPLHIAIWKALGANPTPIPITETYSALSTGVVDFMDMTKDGFEALRLYEVAPYFTQTDHIWSIGGIVFSRRFWDRLTEEQQTILQQTANEMASFFNRLQQKEIAVALDRAVERGATVVPTDPGPWRKAMRPIWTAEASKFGGMDAILAIVNTH
jgi:tripartite ATP-independent transporter DctP family solute receptor